MQIARTTVQRIYEIARKKIADALIDGHPLKIEGGDFRICDGQSNDCRALEDVISRRFTKNMQ